MRSLVAGVASVLTAALLAGCAAAGNSTVTVSGKSLTIYVSAPPGTADPVAQDVLDAEELAFAQKQADVTRATNFNIRLAPPLQSGKLSDHARTAISDTHAIAYLGEIEPGASADTLGITNALDLLQVSPTDTALELTQQSGAVPGSPGRYYESLKNYGRTFARVVPTSAREAKAQVQEMQSLGVKQHYVTGDGSPYGRALALAVTGDAKSAGLTVVSSAGSADAAFYAGSDAAAAARAFSGVVQSRPSIKLFAPSALDGNTLARALGSQKVSLYVSSPGFMPKDLPALGRTFASDFQAKYGHAPAPEAIFGYEAMSAVLDVLKQAGSKANNRATVVKDFLAIHNRQSVLGTYSIDSASGDTNLVAFVFSRLRGGNLVPFKSVGTLG